MTIPAIALFLLLAQPPGPQAPVASASIEGVAAKAGTGESLSKVTVTLMQLRAARPASSPTESRTIVTVGDSGLLQTLTTIRTPGGNNFVESRQSVTSGTDGKFIFENLKPGDYQLAANATGYAPLEYGQRGPNGRGMTFSLKAGQKMQDVSLTMTPGGSITGRVVDANGDPVSRAVVQAQKVIYQERGRSLATLQTVTTDDRGDYRLFWLPPGQYFVSASPNDDRMRTRNELVNGAANIAGVVPGVTVTSTTLSNGETVEEAVVPVFYPTALTPANATPIEVRSGIVTGGINITSMTSRVYRIRGTVMDGATGRPVPTTSLSLIAKSSSMLSQSIRIPTTSNIAGFEISGVVPGSYYIMASERGQGVAAVDVRATNVNDVVILITEAVTLTGHFSVEGVTKTPPVQIDLVPQAAENPAFPFGQSQTDGSFSIFGLLPGDYRVSVGAPAGIVPKSMLYNGRDAQAEGIHIGGATGDTLDIVLTSKSGRLDGNVLVDRQQRAQNATVVLRPVVGLRQQTDLYQTVQSNAEGHFSIETIPPGNYRVFAWDDIPNNAWFDAEYVRDFESQGRDIAIREGAMESLDLTVIPR